MNDKEISEYLRERGIYIDIGGCGCCGSPWVTVRDELGKEIYQSDYAIINSMPITAPQEDS